MNNYKQKQRDYLNENELGQKSSL